MFLSTEASGWLILIGIAAGIFILLIFFYLRRCQDIRRQQDQQHQMKQSSQIFKQTLLQSQAEVQEHTFKNLREEIHNNIGQVLSLVSLNLKSIQPTDKEKLHFTADLVNSALSDLISLSVTITSTRVQQVGLAEALKQDLGLLHRTQHYQTIYLGSKEISYLTPDKTMILFSMAQEVLSNITKHAHATEIRIEQTTQNNADCLTISDNGVGFDPLFARGKGSGLKNLQQRAQIINVNVDIVSAIGKGTSVTFTINRPT